MIARFGALSLVAAATACTSTQPVSSPAEFISREQPDRVWATRVADSGVVEIERPRLLGDTLAGFVNDEYQETLLSELRGFAARQPAAGRTILALTGAVGLLAALIGLATRWRRRRRGRPSP